MTPNEVKLENLHARVCGSKIRHRNFGRALKHANASKAKGVWVSPYACPFADDHHWHVGHPPCIETIKQIALAIRGLPLVEEAA